MEIWECTEAVVGRALEATDLDGTDLAAVGITNQRETTVLWDAETGEPVHDAIVWQDRRTTARVEALEADGRADEIRASTGLEPDAYFSATKLEWLLSEGGEALRERAAAGEVAFGTVDAWLCYNLTGVHATDVTNASRTMLFDVHDMGGTTTCWPSSASRTRCSRRSGPPAATSAGRRPTASSGRRFP